MFVLRSCLSLSLSFGFGYGFLSLRFSLGFGSGFGIDLSSRSMICSFTFSDTKLPTLVLAKTTTWDGKCVWDQAQKSR
jgi:hypothetical protein